MQKTRKGRADNSSYSKSGGEERRSKQRAFCVGVARPGDDEERHLAELRELLRTARADVVGEMTQAREKPHPNLYLGPGKLIELKEAAKLADANMIVCDDELSPRQERNLEEELKLPVIDRTSLILDIFASHAHTAEGKLQVELAQLQYNLARMRGLWTHLERLGGGIGTRGPGETQIETDRRLARNRISALKRKLAHVSSGRNVMRQERERTSLPTIALAGYTNAGKSTLLGALCETDADIRDRLFHTLDPTTRTAEIAGRKFLVTDTVGFIRKLPHDLVEAFGATLEETKRADLIVHVADADEDDERLLEIMEAVDGVLEEIGATEQPRLLVFNKSDLITDDRKAALRGIYPNSVQISASDGEGIDLLEERIEESFRSTLAKIELLLPYSEGKLLGELHDLDGELEREDTAEGVRVKVNVPVLLANRFERFEVSDSE